MSLTGVLVSFYLILYSRTPGQTEPAEPCREQSKQSLSRSPSQSVAPSVSQRVRQSASEAQSRHNDAGHIFPRQRHEYSGFVEC